MRWYLWFSVEPVVALYSLCYSSYYIVWQQLMLERACLVNFSQSAQTCASLPQHPALQARVQVGSPTFIKELGLLIARCDFRAW